MPPDDTKVTPSEVRHAAQQVDAARADIGLAAFKAEGSLQSHAGGWVGDSKKALENAIKELHEHSDKLTKQLAQQHEAMHKAANTLEARDIRNGKKISSADDSSTPSLNMETNDSAPLKPYNRGMK